MKKNLLALLLFSLCFTVNAQTKNDKNLGMRISELEDRVAKLAFVLRHDFGLEPGDRIVNLAQGDIRHFEMQFACARAGLIWAPLNFRLTIAELASLLQGAAARARLVILKGAGEDFCVGRIAPRGYASP